jgi:hypothetical protein
VSESDSKSRRRPFRRHDDETPPPPIGHNSKWVSLPPNFAATVTYATIDEIASFCRCGRWTVHARIADGTYVAFKDGRLTKIVVASVLAERAATIAKSKNPTGKRPVGRPRKKPEKPAPSTTMEDATA